jgi:hypothetical protein
VVECCQEWRGVWHAWNLATGKELVQAEPFNRVTFSADGRFVLTGWASNGGSPSTAPALVRDLRTGEKVGPGLHLPPSFFFVGLSRDGSRALVADDTLQVRVYSACDGRCIMARPVRVASNSLAFSPDGSRVAVWDQAQGAAGIVEVRDVQSGRLVSKPLPTPGTSNHLDFSADGRLLAVESGSAVRLLDVQTGLPLGPWLQFASSGRMLGDLPNDEFRIAEDGVSLLTRYSWQFDAAGQQYWFQIWDLKPEGRPVDQLAELAELLAGRRLTESGEVVPFGLDEYRQRWQEARGRHAEWFAAEAPKKPEKVPSAPPPKPLAFGQPLPRPEETPDYTAVFKKFGGADHPPLLSIAAALEDKNDSLRRAALDAAVALSLDRPLAMSLLIEAIHDSGLRNRAIEQLAALGQDAGPALPALLAELRLELRLAKKYNVFGSEGDNVARALGKIGPSAAEAVTSLRELIASIPLTTTTPVEVEAARALGRIGPAASDGLPELVGLLLKYPDSLRAMSWMDGYKNPVVVRALQRVTAGHLEKLVPHLVKALKLTPERHMANEAFILSQAQFDRRIGIVEVIGRLGPQARGTEFALRAVLAEPPSKNSRDLLRPAAAEALWRVTGKADDVLPVLTACLAEHFEHYDPNFTTRQGRAAAALGRIGAPAKSALPALLLQVEKGVSVLDRLDAAEAVWRLTGDAEPVLPLLRALLEKKLVGGDWVGPDKRFQARAIVILSLMGKPAAAAAPALAAAIRAEDEINAHGTARFSVANADPEDESLDTSDLLRRTGLPVLRQLDPATAKALELPAK